jgi:hypothetical protein
MQRRDRVAVLWLAGLLVLCRAPAFADGPPRPEPVWVPEPVPESVRADEAPDAEEKWDFVVAPYIWLPAMTGDATVKGFDLSIDTDIEDIFAKTDFAFSISGVFETWYRRRWGMQLNAYWAILQQNRNLGGTPAEFDVTANMGLFELVGLYDIGERRFGSGSSGPTWSIQPLAGARVTVLRNKLDVQPFPLSRQDTTAWVDPFLGARTILRFGSENRWSWRFRGDFGGFGAGSSFTWNLMGAFGYDFHIRRAAASAYLGARALYQDFEEGSGRDKFRWDVTQYGPFVALALWF